MIGLYDKNILSQNEFVHQFSLSADMSCHSLAGIHEINTLQPDLVICHIHDQNDVEIVQQLMDEGQSIIVIRPDHIVLDHIADFNEIIKKPLRFVQLIAHIRFYIERQLNYDFAPFEIGPYQCMPSSKELIDQQGTHIKLTEKETDILCYLYSAKSQVVTREKLLSEVWGYNSHVTTHTLETHMYRLRKKIELDPSHAEYLITEAGGYKLNLM